MRPDTHALPHTHVLYCIHACLITDVLKAEIIHTCAMVSGQTCMRVCVYHTCVLQGMILNVMEAIVPTCHTHVRFLFVCACMCVSCVSQGMILDVMEAIIPIEVSQESNREALDPPTHTDPGRPLEVLFGILGNLAAHSDIAVLLAQRHALLDCVTLQALHSVGSSAALGELCRLATTALCKSVSDTHTHAHTHTHPSIHATLPYMCAYGCVRVSRRTRDAERVLAHSTACVRVCVCTQGSYQWYTRLSGPLELERVLWIAQRTQDPVTHTRALDLVVAILHAQVTHTDQHADTTDHTQTGPEGGAGGGGMDTDTHTDTTAITDSAQCLVQLGLLTLVTDELNCAANQVRGHAHTHTHRQTHTHTHTSTMHVPPRFIGPVSIPD